MKSNLTQVSDPNEIYATRVHDRKIVLENPVKESRTKKEREEKRARRKQHQQKKVLGKRERGIWKFDQSQTKWVLAYTLRTLFLNPKPEGSTYLHRSIIFG